MGKATRHNFHFWNQRIMFGRGDADLTCSARKFIASLPPTYTNLFRKKRRLLPIWSSHKYCVVIKSSYLIYYIAGKQVADENKVHRYLNLFACETQVVNDDAAGFVVHVIPKQGRSVSFVADNEKDRTKFVQQVAKIQKSPPSLLDFTTLSLIGKGHYGRVILAQGKRNNQLYAIKEMKLGQTKQKVMHIERMVMEWSGEHPFVLGLDYAFGQGKSLFLVSKFMEGGDLFLHMQKRGGSFDEDAIRFFAAELLLALGHLHRVHIIHRDIKPENILLDKDGHIKLADMGLAKRLESQLDRTDTICGTDAYLAPEMVEKSAGGHGLAVDMWQLGCLLFELNAGCPPFYVPNATKRQTHNRIMKQEPRYPNNLSSEFLALLTALLDKNSANRLGSKGIAYVKQHAFFKDINWDDVIQKKLTPPIVPSPAGSNFVNNFDSHFTNQPHEIKALDGKTISKDFSGFDYVHPEAEQYC